MKQQVMGELRSKHITRFGSPLAGPGALYFVCDQDGLLQMDIDMKLAELSTRGTVITADVKSQVKRDVRQRKSEYNTKVNQLGVPDKLKDLFVMDRKSQVEQYCRDLVLSEHDLFLLIHNCSQLRFTHRAKFKQYIPEHLKVNDADRDQMKSGSPKKFLKKTRAGLSERRYIHVHLFECGSEWHCFYFSHQDIEPTGTNHWANGCHLHYVSHLWANLKKRRVWDEFNKRSTEIQGSIHIRFEPFDYLSPSEANKRRLNKTGKQALWAFAFDPNLACGCDAIALPVPCVATRGLWAVEVSPSRPLR